MEKINYRSYIKIRVSLKVDASTIFKELETSLGINSPSFSTVKRWDKYFREGGQDLEDDPRSGRPATAVTSDNIERIRQLIEEDPRVSYKYIEAETFISPPAIYIIIHDRLKLRKLASRWVPYELTDAHRAQRVEACRENLAKYSKEGGRLYDIITGDESWIYHRKIERKASNYTWVAEGQSPGTVVRRGRFEAKTMITVFFKSSGVLLLDCMDEGETITSKYYLKNCLKPVVRVIKQQRPTSGTKNMKILHDNAKPHIAKEVKKYLESEGIEIIRHPPYSPDLAPCDFWLFDLIKKQLVDAQDAQSLKRQITAILESIPKEEYLKTFQKWIERMQLCINNDGHYFEHLIKKNE